MIVETSKKKDEMGAINQNHLAFTDFSMISFLIIFTENATLIEL